MISTMESMAPRFVEMNLVYGQAMGLGLRLRHDPKHTLRQLLHAVIGVQTVDDDADIGVVAVDVGMMVVLCAGTVDVLGHRVGMTVLLPVPVVVPHLSMLMKMPLCPMFS